MNTESFRSGKLQRLLQASWPAQLYPVLLPLPAVLFWHSHDGRFVALCLFFAGCAGLVAHVFRDKTASSFMPMPQRELWRRRMGLLTTTLLFQWLAFSVLCLTCNDATDFMVPVLAFGSLIPALCVTPCLTLATRKPFAAVVFTLFLVGGMKILGCVVVVLVYGWHADARGYTTLTWTQPNLLVSLFLANCAALSGLFHFFGHRKFMRVATASPDLNQNLQV